MFRVVLDSNVLARAVMSPNGLAADLLTQLVKSEHQLCTSDFMLAELVRVLSFLMRSAELFPGISGISSGLPDEPVAIDEQNDIPHFPRYGPSKVIEPRLSTLPRLPDPIFD